MCNLYELYVTGMNNIFGKSLSDVMNLPQNEVFPGYPGIVMTATGVLRKMTWGFPLVLKGKNGQPLKPKPVNNARTDKLDSFMWRDSFQNRRCLIPVSRFAEAEGPKGSMTRTWFKVPGDEPFAVAGIWRDSPEWAECYSMVMTESTGAVSRTHDRMPVIIAEADRERWLRDEPAEALVLCKPFKEQIDEDRTADPWFRRKAPEKPQ